MMKLLIVGRTGTGKDTLKEELIKLGITFSKSSTTRARRFPEENTYHFLTEEEAAAIPKKDKFIWTTKDGKEYFSDRTEVEKAEALVVDPKGVYELLSFMPSTYFVIVYLYTDNRTEQKKMAMMRSEDPKKAADIFESRYSSEDNMFTKFENKIKNGCFHPRNLKAIYLKKNNYDRADMVSYAFWLAKMFKM